MRSGKISRLVRKQVADLRAYHVDEPPVRIKLNANESPFDIPDAVRGEIQKEVSQVKFNRYPDPDCTELRRLLASQLGVGTGQLLLGNGSDELIQMIIMAFGGHGVPIIFPHPTFSMYRNIAFAMGEDVISLPLNSTLDLDKEPLLNEVKKGPSITFISYPNNPTGNCFSEESIGEIVSASEGVVVIDEAYFDYSRKTFLERLGEHTNLIILRTLSKIGLASLRIGILIASAEIAEIVNRVRLPYNISSISRIAALKALESRDEINRMAEIIIAERSRVFNALADIDAVTPLRTDSNFILFRVEDADAVFRGLIERDVLIRNLNSDGTLKNCLRVTIGKPEENEQFIRSLSDICTGI